MIKVYCDVSDCANWDDGKCTLEELEISGREMTAAGFFPMCQEYVFEYGEEKE